MVEPPLSSLMKKVDTRFTLCIVVSKRARQLTGGACALTGCDSDNAITIASNELNEDIITYRKKASKEKRDNKCYTPELFDQDEGSR